MGFIPDDAEWYLAGLIVEIRVEDDPRNVLHINQVLVHADSPEEAYQKALELGAENNYDGMNPEGKALQSRFRGLFDLNVIHDKLEHGAEISYSEDIGVEESKIQKWISSKESLGVFAPMQPSKGPDYRSQEIVEKVRKMMGE